jgi:outer membrane protein assembly factor BamB
MQMALEMKSEVLAVVLARDIKKKDHEGLRREPVVYGFNLGTGKELWNYKVESDIEMMPSRWTEEEDDTVEYTLNNYHPPLFLDGRLYLFYDGVTALDASTGKQLLREKFRVNEEGLALTEADAVFDERFLYVSGRGRVRAISRTKGEIAWEAKDAGMTPEMFLDGTKLYVRTGGQFTRLRDGEIDDRGPFGVTAIDIENGKTLWRYKPADRGITNIAFFDSSTLLLADREELILLDSEKGKALKHVKHKVSKAAFLLVNENRDAVVGGTNEVRAFNVASGTNLGHVRYDPPGRGAVRTIAAIAARAGALYFRYGPAVTTAATVTTRTFHAINLAQAGSSVRWSGLARAALPDLTTLAETSAHRYVTTRFRALGVASRIQDAARTAHNLQETVERARQLQGSLSGARLQGVITSNLSSSGDIEERLLDRMDPASQLEKLSRFLWHRKRLTALKGKWMYFYTDLPGEGGKGLAGVNIDTGETEREIKLSDPDYRFTTDETINLLYSARENRLAAFPIPGNTH